MFLKKLYNSEQTNFLNTALIELIKMVVYLRFISIMFT